MIRFFLFYFLVIHYRVIRLMFRSKITGDTNYLSSPILTMRRIFSHSVLGAKWTLVDIGCGEGLVGMFVRLIQRKSVVFHDIQTDFLRMIYFFSRCFFLTDVSISRQFLPSYSTSSVFLCVWTSWSDDNRSKLLAQLTDIVPSGSILITVSHGIIHPSFIEVDKIRETFAWGKANVYYYKHA